MHPCDRLMTKAEEPRTRERNPVLAYRTKLPIPSSRFPAPSAASVAVPVSTSQLPAPYICEGTSCIPDPCSQFLLSRSHVLFWMRGTLRSSGQALLHILVPGFQFLDARLPVPSLQLPEPGATLWELDSKPGATISGLGFKPWCQPIGAWFQA